MPKCTCNNETCKAARRTRRTRSLHQIMKQAACDALKNSDAYQAVVTLELATAKYPYGSTREFTAQEPNVK